MNDARLTNPSNCGGAYGAENATNTWFHLQSTLRNSTCTVTMQFNDQMNVNVKEIYWLKPFVMGHATNNCINNCETHPPE